MTSGTACPKKSVMSISDRRPGWGRPRCQARHRIHVGGKGGRCRRSGLGSGRGGTRWCGRSPCRSVASSRRGRGGRVVVVVTSGPTSPKVDSRTGRKESSPVWPMASRARCSSSTPGSCTSTVLDPDIAISGSWTPPTSSMRAPHDLHGLLEHLLIGAGRCGQDDRGSTLEIEAELGGDPVGQQQTRPRPRRAPAPAQDRSGGGARQLGVSILLAMARRVNRILPCSTSSTTESSSRSRITPWTPPMVWTRVAEAQARQ